MSMYGDQKKLLSVLLSFSGAVVIIASFMFYWYEVKPQADKKDCFKLAETQKANALEADNKVIMSGQTVTRANYDQIFDTEYNNCMKRKGY